MNNIIETYNPANATNINQEQQDEMQNLSKEEVAALAQAYPNNATNNNYLVLLDKRLPLEKQLFQLSSWQNLNDLWKVGQQQFVAFGFRNQLRKAGQPAPIQATSTPVAPKAVIDLSELESQQAAGLRKEETPADNSGGDIPVFNPEDQGNATLLPPAPIATPVVPLQEGQGTPPATPAATPVVPTAQAGQPAPVQATSTPVATGRTTNRSAKHNANQTEEKKD